MEGEDEATVEDPELRNVVDEGADDPDASRGIKPHPDADTFFLITKPTGLGNQLPAGKDVSLLVGFTNQGNVDFLVESMEASFRYAMDFSFHLQNFSAIAYNRLVKPKEQATFAYSFFVSDAYSTRPYGFTVNLNYKDAVSSSSLHVLLCEGHVYFICRKNLINLVSFSSFIDDLQEGNQYLSPVFNETVSIIELDEGLDTETFFLYVILIALLGLGVFSIYHYFFASKKRSSFNMSSSSAKTVEVGTANNKDVDYDWLPQGHLEAMGKSPKASKPSSPRQRKIRSE